MTAATSGRQGARSQGDYNTFIGKDAESFYVDTLISHLTSTGHVQNGADTASTTFAGVVRTEATGDAETRNVEAYCSGTYEFAFSGTAAITDEGAKAYIVDNQTVGLAATTTNDIACGVIVEFISTAKVRVRIDGYAMAGA